MENYQYRRVCEKRSARGTGVVSKAGMSNEFGIGQFVYAIYVY